MAQGIKIFNKNLVGTGHNVQLGLHGSQLKSIQGDVQESSRTPTTDDDDLHARLPDDSGFARLKLQDVRTEDVGDSAIDVLAPSDCIGFGIGPQEVTEKAWVTRRTADGS